jgi:hypothetical protein
VDAPALKESVANTNIAVLRIFDPRQPIQEDELPRRFLFGFFGCRCVIKLCAAEPPKLSVWARLNSAIARLRNRLQPLDIQCFAIELDQGPTCWSG